MQEGLGRHDPFWPYMSNDVLGVVDDISVTFINDDVEREVRYFTYRVRRTVEHAVSRYRMEWDYNA